MPREESRSFTDRELEIMRVVWALGRATVKEIQERLPGHRHYNSVLTIVRVLERKGHLSHEVNGRQYIYSPTESHDAARSRALDNVVENLFGGSAASMVLKLVDSGSLTPKELEEIRKKLRRGSAERRGRK